MAWNENQNQQFPQGNPQPLGLPTPYQQYRGAWAAGPAGQGREEAGVGQGRVCIPTPSYLLIAYAAILFPWGAGFWVGSA